MNITTANIIEEHGRHVLAIIDPKPSLLHQDIVHIGGEHSATAIVEGNELQMPGCIKHPIIAHLARAYYRIKKRGDLIPGIEIGLHVPKTINPMVEAQFKY